MKKLLTLTAVGAILAAPAIAVKKCLQLDSSIPALDFAYTDTTWSATFNGYTISGIAQCSTTSCLDDLGATRTTISSTVGKYCWCKVTSPTTGVYWVGGADDNDDNAECLDSCGWSCGNKMESTTNEKVRAALISSITN